MDKLTEEYDRLQCNSPREKASTGPRFDFPALQHSSRRLDFSSGSSGDYSTSSTGLYSGSPRDTRERKDSWGKSMGDVLDTYIKKPMSYIMPVSFSMTCHALIQQHVDQRTFGLVVVCQKENETEHCRRSTHGNKVGSTIHPKSIKPGRLRITLLSKEFDADIAHGETSLSKDELEFRGSSFEVQFACRYKRSATSGGVFGKVRVERITEKESQKIFEFNLSKVNIGAMCNPSSEDTWATMAVTDVAGMLQITDEEQWRTAAKRLGFTEHEIESKFATWDDPVPRLLDAYKTRGGTPSEFIENLRRSVGMSVTVATPQEEPPPQSPRRRYRPRPLTLNPPRIQNVTDTEPLGFEAACLGDFTDTTGRNRVKVPPTPPSTPQKRPAHAQLADKCVSPLKRLRRESSGDTDFTFDFPTDKQDVSESELWTISSHINNHWKPLGRNLGLPEDELLSIGHSHKNLRECSYQVLLKWKDMCPSNFNYQTLFGALIETGLHSVAHKYCVAK